MLLDVSSVHLNLRSYANADGTPVWLFSLTVKGYDRIANASFNVKAWLRLNLTVLGAHSFDALNRTNATAYIRVFTKRPQLVSSS